MAYLFKSINEQLNQAQPTDIFQPQAPSGDQAGQAGGGAVEKTSSSGELPVQSSQSGPATREKEQQISAKAVMQNQMGQQAYRPIVDRAKTDLNTAGTALQDEANRYVANQTKRDSGFDQASIDRALSGQTDDYSKTAGRLAATAAPVVSPYAQQTDYTVDDIGSISNKAGLRTALSRQQNERYTRGESALDAALLYRNPEFRRISEALRGDQSVVDQKAKSLRESSPELAQQTVNQNYDQDTKKIKDYLGSELGSLSAAQEAEAAQENARRQAIDLGAYARSQANPLDSELLSGVEEDKIAAVGGRVDPSQFVSAPGQLTAEDVVNAEEAARFNRIYGLLGMGQAKTAGQVSPDVSFDATSYRAALQSLIEKMRIAELNKVVDPAAFLPGATPATTTDVSGTITGQVPATDQLSPEEIARMAAVASPPMPALAPNVGLPGQSEAWSEVPDGSYYAPTPPTPSRFDQFRDPLGLEDILFGGL